MTRKCLGERRRMYTFIWVSYTENLPSADELKNGGDVSPRSSHEFHLLGLLSQGNSLIYGERNLQFGD